MKQIFKFWSLVTMVALCAGFSSCSKDDDSGNDTSGNIVGKWSLISMTIDGSPQSVRASDFLEIKKDGDFLEYDAGVYAVGTWKQINGKLELEYDSAKTFELYPNQGLVIYFPVSLNITKLTDKEMVLKATVLGFDGVATYKRHK